LLANFFFTTPYHTLVVDQRDSIIALVAFVLVAVIVSVTVEVAMSHRIEAARSRAEAEVLSRFTAEPVRETSLTAVLQEVRDTFGMARCWNYWRHRARRRHSRRPPRGHPVISVPAADGLRLVAEGRGLFAEDRKLLTRLARARARAWEGQQLAGEAPRPVSSPRSKAHIAKAMGVSRKCVSAWIDRYEAEGEQGLHDRSSRPARPRRRLRSSSGCAMRERERRGRTGSDPSSVSQPGRCRGSCGTGCPTCTSATRSPAS
jgi:transposase-like protein